MFVDSRATSRSNSTSNFCCLVAEKLNIPILWDYPDFGLLEARVHVHEKPILSRCPFTLASNSTKRLTICGSGVS